MEGLVQKDCPINRIAPSHRSDYAFSFDGTEVAKGLGGEVNNYRNQLTIVLSGLF